MRRARRYALPPIAAASGGFAQPAPDKMLQSSVAVFGAVQENGKTRNRFELRME